MLLNHYNTTIDADIDTSGDFPVLSLNGNKYVLSASKINDNSFIFTIDGVKHLVFAAEDDNSFYVNISGRNILIAKVKEEEKSFGDDSKSSADKEIVKPPMPGSVVKVLAEKGKEVAEGEALVIVEAMKMETTIYSSISGIVTEVNVSPGMQIDADKILMIIEKNKD